jgi:hypothetical protein
MRCENACAFYLVGIILLSNVLIGVGLSFARSVTENPAFENLTVEILRFVDSICCSKGLFGHTSNTNITTQHEDAKPFFCGCTANDPAGESETMWLTFSFGV